MVILVNTERLSNFQFYVKWLSVPINRLHVYSFVLCLHFIRIQLQTLCKGQLQSRRWHRTKNRTNM